MKFLSGCSALLLVSISAAAHSATNDGDRARQSLSLDRVVAIVNTEVITRLELDDQVKLATRQLVRQGTPLPQRDLLEKQLLERMITTRVLRQVGQETGVRIDDTQLERAIARMAQENKMSPEQFRATMRDDGIDYDRFREDIRGDIIVSRLRTGGGRTPHRFGCRSGQLSDFAESERTR